MKILGTKIEGPNVEMIVIPRGETEVVFLAGAVLDYTELTQLIQEPKAPMITRRGENFPTPDLFDPKYMKAKETYSDQKMNWLILKSLSTTEGLEWETVNMSDPSTWGNYESELKTSGFTNFEINRIIAGIFSANGLDENKIEQARKRFLASQALPKEA